MALLEIAYRLLRRGRRLGLDLTGWISLAGLILGVASLSVSMAAISGFEKTLRQSLSDVSGHVQIFKFRVNSEDSESLTERVKKLTPELKSSTRFLSVEGVLAHSGRIQGVFMQGLDPQSAWQVLNLKKRLISGELSLDNKGEYPKVMIGKGVAETFGLKPGDTFRLLVPLPSEFDPQEFKRKLGVFQVAGVLELGKYEYDQRMVLMPLSNLQNLADVGDRDSGLILNVGDEALARDVSFRLGEQLGTGFRVRDWRDINENLLEAVEIEKVVIFFVILLIVVAAAFNVATSLYVNVVQRYPEIGILKALGVSPREMTFILCLQGLVLGVIGCVCGLGAGVLLGYAFEWAQFNLGLLPPSVYKVSHIAVDFRWQDSVLVSAVTLVICGLATLAPARQGSKLSPVEGLRYE